MAVFETWLNQDLQKPLKPQVLDGSLFTQDNLGNKIGVILTDGGQPATLSGTVSGSVIRADGATVATDAGVLSGNEAYVLLPEAAYAVPGQIVIIIKLTTGSTVTTIGAAIAFVQRSATGSIVDPGDIIPSIADLIDALENAESLIPADKAAIMAALAPTFSSGTYKAGRYVWYDGVLYRFIHDHSGTWASADVVAASSLNEIQSGVNSAVERELPAMQSVPDALERYSRNQYIHANAISGMAVWAAPQEIRVEPSNAHTTISDYIPVLPGDVVTLGQTLNSSTFGTALCDASKSIKSVLLSNNTNKVFTIPSGIYWIVTTQLTDDAADQTVTISRPSSNAARDFLDKYTGSANLVSYGEVTSGKYWNISLDGLATNEDWYAVKIPVFPGQMIFVSGLSAGAISGGVGYAVRNADDSATIQAGNEYNNWHFTIPANGYWLYISDNLSTQYTIQVRGWVREREFESAQFPFPLSSQQYVIPGVYLDNTGTMQENVIYALTGYLKIVGGQTYEVNTGTMYATQRGGGFYDANKNWIGLCPSSSSANDSRKYRFTAPQDAEYVRLCCLKENVDKITCTLVSSLISSEQEIIVLGDSWSDTYTSSSYTKWPTIYAQFSSANIHNYARNGSCIYGNDNWALNGTLGGQVAAALADVSFNHAAVTHVVIVGGINDYRSGISEASVLSAIQSIVTRMRVDFNKAKFVCVFNHQMFLEKAQWEYFQELKNDVRSTIGIPAYTSFGWFPASDFITSDYVHPDNDGHAMFAANMMAVINGGAPTFSANEATVTGTKADITIRETFTNDTYSRSFKIEHDAGDGYGEEAYEVTRNTKLLANIPFVANCWSQSHSGCYALGTSADATTETKHQPTKFNFKINLGTDTASTYYGTEVVV